MNEAVNKAPSTGLSGIAEILGQHVTNLTMDVTSSHEASRGDVFLVKSIVLILEGLKESRMKHAPILDLAAFRDYLLTLNNLLQGYEVEGIDKELVQRVYEMFEGILLERRRVEMAMRENS